MCKDTWKWMSINPNGYNDKQSISKEEQEADEYVKKEGFFDRYDPYIKKIVQEYKE